MPAPYLPPLDAGGESHTITPTDVSQFLRLDQCRRYLRLRLTERTAHRNFMRDYDVVPQRIPPLLTRSGALFERKVEAAVDAASGAAACRAGTTEPLLPGSCRKVDLAQGVASGDREEDNARVVAMARALSPGATLFVFQPRLAVTIAGWRIRGDLDVLRLERDAQGRLHILIIDMKSSTTAKVEHRLQVAFYHEMLAALFGEATLEYNDIELGILYRGPANLEEVLETLSDDERERLGEQRAAACRYFHTADGFLEILTEAERRNYTGSVYDLVTSPQSIAAEVAAAEFAAVPFHLTYKCDGCLYNEFCLKWSAEQDDLSLLPHLAAPDKNALHQGGIHRVGELARLKELKPAQPGDIENPGELATPPAQRARVAQLAATWPVGPRLDELIHRARRYRRSKGEEIAALSYIPSKGYGSLPYCDAEHNPNLVRIYIDAQHDYLQDRLYLIGSRVVAASGGTVKPDGQRSVVYMTDGPPEHPVTEEKLILDWIRDTLQAVLDVVEPDADGLLKAPVHFIFYNAFEQRLLLEALGRHGGAISEATPLYDFMTQLAAFDSPIATFLDQEIRELKNYPLLCQSLQAVAGYLGFDWNEGTPYREIFHARLFDERAKFDALPLGATPDESPWYTGRARFNSQIPLEYAYAAWGQLEDATESREGDEFTAYRGATPELLKSFHERRLAALQHIAADFIGNRQTLKTPFDLTILQEFSGKAATMAHALEEFVTIERHVELAAWKKIRLAPPERRVLDGESLIVCYEEDDQFPGVAERNRENRRKAAEKKAWKEANPEAKRTPKELNAPWKWDTEGVRFRLRVECVGVDCDLEQVLAMNTLGKGDRVVLMPRWTVDSRLPAAEQTPFTPTPKQMLYGQRAEIVGIVRADPHATGTTTEAFIEIEMRRGTGGGSPGFVFGSGEEPLQPGACYTLDSDPNDIYGSWCAQIAKTLGEKEAAGDESNVLYHRLRHLATARVAWSAAARDGQQRFLEGLRTLEVAGAFHALESSKCDFIGRYGEAPVLLVQGPPGTGKSYATAFALFARLQGALAAGQPWRAFIGCKTHAATDVLLENVVNVQRKLREFHDSHPQIFARYFDERLLTVPLLRLHGRTEPPDGVRALRKAYDRAAGEPQNGDEIVALPHCIVATTPGGVYGLLREHGDKEFFGHALCHCLVLDEASQMNLPEAIMAALPLAPEGQLIVVGDHRQMPPIVKHAWENEPRRTFSEFRSYESLFLALLALDVPTIKFAESFRLHADIAEFLRAQIYHLDGIDYHSKKYETLESHSYTDDFVAAVLSSEHPLIVVTHDEQGSLLSNPFERRLMTPVLETLSHLDFHGLDAAAGLGVVVPHRAQRAALLDELPGLRVVDPETGAVLRSAVDTVERFQGGEREAIMVGATESDREYLLVSGQFLMDPRRLNVALSRARKKMILVASQSVFQLISPDEETFANAQLWKNLLRHTCTVPLWYGTRDGYNVQVWGNVATRSS